MVHQQLVPVRGRWVPSFWAKPFTCKYEIVKRSLRWTDARKYCTDRGGDLIQNNVHSLQERKQLSEILNLGQSNWHVGIRRDANGVWRRASDGIASPIYGWFPGFPRSDKDRDYLVWSTW